MKNRQELFNYMEEQIEVIERLSYKLANMREVDLVYFEKQIVNEISNAKSMILEHLGRQHIKTKDKLAEEGHVFSRSVFDHWTPR